MNQQQQTNAAAAVLAALAAPFDRTEVKFRPGAVSGNRALAMPYIDARAVMDRLDAVVGAANWQDHYEFLPDGSVMCQLQLRIDGEWISKADVGGPSEQPDEGDRHKAAVSDALKRAAVKWGVGRYLYRLAPIWADYDPAKKRFTRQPELSTAAAARNGTPAPAPANDKPAAPAHQPAERAAPKTPPELAERLRAFGEALVKAGLCERVDELLDFVRGQLGTGRAPQHLPPRRWPAELIPQAMRKARAFEQHRRQRAAPARPRAQRINRADLSDRPAVQAGRSISLTLAPENSTMLNWITRLFGSWDRQEKAADRAAVALEDIADDLERVRDTLHARLNGTDAPAIHEERSESARNGKRKAIS